MAKPLFIFFLLITTSSLCQNEVVISLPEVSPMYFGYFNAVEISYKKKKIKNISVECDYCDTIKQHPKISTHWLIMPGDSSHLTLTVKRKNGKVVGKQKFKVFTPPLPNMYLDNINTQSTITSVPKSLRVKYEPYVPLHTVFMTRNWEIEIGEETFKGSGSGITEEVHNQLKKEGIGVMVISATFVGPYGPFLLKDIFEFAIE